MVERQAAGLEAGRAVKTAEADKRYKEAASALAEYLGDGDRLNWEAALNAPEDDQRSVERIMGWEEGEFRARMQQSGSTFKKGIKKAMSSLK